jgi:chromosome partitioning protein
MIIVIGSHKGGAGKSTLATNIATTLTHQKKDVILIDADRQETATQWSLEREENPSLIPIPCLSKTEGLRATLLDLNKRYEYVLVDVAGRNSKELRVSLTIADIFLCPCRASQPDLNTLPKVAEMISEAQEINPKLNCSVYLSCVPTTHNSTEIRDSIGLISHFDQFKLLKSKLTDRKSYRDSIAEGKGVIELSDEKAKEEIQNFTLEILTKTSINTDQPEGV